MRTCVTVPTEESDDSEPGANGADNEEDYTFELDLEGDGVITTHDWSSHQRAQAEEANTDAPDMFSEEGPDGIGTVQDADNLDLLNLQLLKVDLDIVHPATGELDEAKEDVNDGGYVTIKREVEDEHIAPITELKLHANSSLPSSSKFRIKFAGEREILDGERHQCTYSWFSKIF